ncbi:redoxin domain-containing protein [Arcicella sp. DC2W]|uniref:Redoxin domain-containing protein n=1 Tax=Arcicella gelida TaxID=2984195 RepID=A0ABU5S5Z5_9BACT|nr:redoxin domain-containing protein [Arcicella sp. DC2W]MEA5403845.1 redoxin domain-containing protein [Arcicella sp. DC2W]
MQEIIDKNRPRALQASNFVPNFNIIRANGRWANLPKNIDYLPNFTLSELILFRPLVLSFFSPSWNNYAEIHLELLQKAHKRLKNVGAEILLLTDVAPDDLDILVSKYKLTFNICHDQENAIAEELGVFSKDYPIWHRITGISKEVPLPATFIIVGNLLIIYSFVDDDFESIFSIKEMEAFIKLYRNK